MISASRRMSGFTPPRRCWPRYGRQATAYAVTDRPMGRNPPNQNRAIKVAHPASSGAPRSADRRWGQPPIGWRQ